MSHLAEPSPLRLVHRLGYGAGDLAFVALWQGCALFLLYFYTDTLGLPPVVAGAIYLVGMAWDALSDPVIATWSEARARRGGGYGRQILLAAAPASLTFVLVFTNPFSEILAMTLWATLTHLLFRTAFTFASMPYNALPARLTSDGDTRSALSAIRVMFAALGGLAAAILMPVIIAGAGDASARNGHWLAAIAIGVIAGLVLLICGRSMRIAPPLSDGEDSEDDVRKAGLAELWTATRRNRPLQGLLVLMALATTGYGLFTQSLIYLVNHVFVRPDLVPLALATPVIALLVSAPLWMMLAARSSKRTTLITGIAVAALGYFGLALSPGDAIGPALLAIAVSGVGSAAIPVMFWSMVPDVVDYGHATTGRRVETRTFGLTTFVQKTGAGLTALLVGGLLALTQYDPQAVTGDARLTIQLMAGWLPGLLSLFMIAAAWRYPLDRDQHRAALARIAETTRSGG